MLSSFPYKQPNISQTQFILHTYLPMKMEQSVPKRRHMKFRRRGITQQKAHNNDPTNCNIDHVSAKNGIFSP
jgi:hypothetical protein